jgi:hypothetical protein
MLRPYKLSPALGGKIVEGTPIDDKLVSVELEGKLVSLPAELLTLVVPPEPFGKVLISLTSFVKEQERNHSVWERVQYENASKHFRRIDSQTQMRTWTELVDMMYSENLKAITWRPSNALYNADRPTPVYATPTGTCCWCNRPSVQIKLDGTIKQHKSILPHEDTGRYNYCKGSNLPPKEAAA